jgi:hypothetical protein
VTADHVIHQRNSASSTNIFGVQPPTDGSESVTQMTMSNVGVRPCPRCGGAGHVMDGTYSITSNAARTLVRLPRDLRSAVSDQLHQASLGQENQGQVAAAIRDLGKRLGDAQAENRTQLEVLANQIAEMKPGFWRYWLPILITVILGLGGTAWNQYEGPSAHDPPAAATAAGTSAPSESEIEGLVRRAIEEQEDAQRVDGSQRTVQKVGRNEPCPCGSGRKYEHCCLK